MEQKTDVKELKKLRDRIDSIDLRILKLLEKRYKTAENIGKIKKKKGLGRYDPTREREIIKRVAKKTSLSKRFVKRTFTNIMEYCRNGGK